MVFQDIFETAKNASMRLIARTIAWGRLTVVASGIEHIPPEGPVILLARHYHHLFDGVALYLVVPRPIHILVAIDWAANRLVRGLFETLNERARWPVVLRSGGGTGTKCCLGREVKRYGRTALQNSVQLLAEGRILLIFPEGYPNIDPHFTPKKSPQDFLPFREGFWAICRAAEKKMSQLIPIVPVGLQYEGERPLAVHIRFGAPLTSADYGSRKLLIRKLEQVVVELSGEMSADARSPGGESETGSGFRFVFFRR